MPYIQRLNTLESISSSDAQQLAIELNTLRTELDEIRANFNAVLTKLDADGGVTDTNYSALNSLATTGATVTTTTAAAARRFTPT